MSDAALDPADDASPIPRMRGIGADGFVDLDIPCRTCGYDLRSLPADSMCPECGADVIGSVRSDQLGLADPFWLHTLGNGARWMMWMLVAQPLLICLVPISRPPSTNYAWVVIQCIALALWLTGVWQLTRPDPSGRGEVEYGDWRYGWLAAAIFSAAFDTIQVIGMVERWAPVGPMWVGRFIVYAAVAYVGFQYLARFAKRLSSERHRVQATLLSYSLPTCYLALATFIALGRPPFAGAVVIGVVYAISQIVHFMFLRSLSDRIRAQRGWRFVG